MGIARSIGLGNSLMMIPGTDIVHGYHTRTQSQVHSITSCCLRSRQFPTAHELKCVAASASSATSANTARSNNQPPIQPQNGCKKGITLPPCSTTYTGISSVHCVFITVCLCIPLFGVTLLMLLRLHSHPPAQKCRTLTCIQQVREYYLHREFPPLPSCYVHGD